MIRKVRRTVSGSEIVRDKQLWSRLFVDVKTYDQLLTHADRLAQTLIEFELEEHRASCESVLKLDDGDCDCGKDLVDIVLTLWRDWRES